MKGRKAKGQAESWSEALGRGAQTTPGAVRSYLFREWASYWELLPLGLRSRRRKLVGPVGPLPWPLGPGGCGGGQEGADRDTIPGKPLPHVLTLSLATSQNDSQPQPEADAQVGAHGGTHGACPVEGRLLSQPCLSAPPDHKASFSIHTLVGGG